MNEYEKILNDFLAENKYKAILDFAKHNRKYRKLKDINTQNSIIISKTLKKDDLDKFESFKENVYSLYDMESDMLYIQGYRDCIKLLKIIGLI